MQTVFDEIWFLIRLKLLQMKMFRYISIIYASEVLFLTFAARFIRFPYSFTYGHMWQVDRVHNVSIVGRIALQLRILEDVLRRRHIRSTGNTNRV